MKILLTSSFYPPYHIGGDAVHVKYLAQALLKKGHDVHIMYSINAYNLKKKEKKVQTNSKVTEHTLNSPLGVLEPILNYCFGTQKYTLNFFKRLIKKEKFDVVHHHNISLLGYNILKKIGPYVNLYTAHDYWLVCHKYDMVRGNDVCQQKRCFSCCLKHRKAYQFFRNSKKFRECTEDIDTVIAPSQFMAGILQKEFSNVKVIHNFIPERSPKINTKKIRDYFIFVGVLEKHKGVMNLIKVFSQLNKKLLLIGTGELEPEIRKLKTKNIELLGWKKQKELFSLVSSAQALIVSSTCLENNPLVALESLSLGTPVIGSDAGGIPEIIEKIDKKLVFNKDNLEQLKKIVVHFDRRSYDPEDIRRIYLNNFSQEIFLKKYLKTIKDDTNN